MAPWPHLAGHVILGPSFVPSCTEPPLRPAPLPLFPYAPKRYYRTPMRMDTIFPSFLPSCWLAAACPEGVKRGVHTAILCAWHAHQLVAPSVWSSASRHNLLVSTTSSLKVLPMLWQTHGRTSDRPSRGARIDLALSIMFSWESVVQWWYMNLLPLVNWPWVRGVPWWFFHFVRFAAWAVRWLLPRKSTDPGFAATLRNQRPPPQQWRRSYVQGALALLKRSLSPLKPGKEIPRKK